MLTSMPDTRTKWTDADVVGWIDSRPANEDGTVIVSALVIFAGDGPTINRLGAAATDGLITGRTVALTSWGTGPDVQTVEYRLRLTPTGRRLAFSLRHNGETPTMAIMRDRGFTHHQWTMCGTAVLGLRFDTFEAAAGYCLDMWGVTDWIESRIAGLGMIIIPTDGQVAPWTA